MKRIVFACLLVVSFLTVYAQKIEKYFDYNGVPCEPSIARFYSLIENTDSGWLRNDYFVSEKRLRMRGLYRDSACKIAHGHFYYFHANSVLQSMGQYKDNLKEGLWIGYYPNKIMSDSTVYNMGERTGTSLQWHSNGYLSDSTVFKEDGSGVAVSWFDNGSVSAAGRLNPMHRNQGKWQYFHHNGKLSASEIFDNGILVDRKYFAENGSAITDTTDRTRQAGFPGGVAEWTNYFTKKLYFPHNYNLVNGDKAVVVVSFVIDENGDVKNVQVESSFLPAFDEIAVNIIQESPRWIPAMDHNRKVKYTHRQAVNFIQK